MSSKESSHEIRPYWDRLWKNDLSKENYYAKYDIDSTTDGISHLLYYALRGCHKGQTMIEIGSGPGTRSIPIAKDLGLQLTLVDVLISAHELAIQRAKRYDQNITAVQSDALNLSIQDGVYDSVVSIGLNEHFFNEDRQRIFNEQHRITKPGGKTIVIVPNKLNLPFNLEFITKKSFGNWTFGPNDFFSPNELLERMKHSNYREIKLFGVSYLTSPIRILPRLLQRSIYSEHKKLWYVWTHSLGNLNIKNPVNRMFGEEIMAIGYK